MILERGRKRKELSSMAGTSVGVKFLEGIYRLIKDNIARDVHTTLGNVKTFESLVKITIPQENTLF
jgi:hypothetical protein